VLLADGDAFERFGRVLGYLAVGLVDQAVDVRVISTNRDVNALSLGPVQTLIRPHVRWPFARRRMAEAVELLSPRVPAVIHALSHDSFDVAADLADAFEADLVFQIGSRTDCDALSDFDLSVVGWFFAVSELLVRLLRDQYGIDGERIAMIHPGLMAAERRPPFMESDRPVTLLCTAPLERSAGIHILIEAVAQLRQRGRSLAAFFTGHGAYEWSLRRQVRDHDLSSLVFFAQPLGNHEELFRGADIFIQPSPDTAFRVDTLAAMAAGLIVVAISGGVMDYPVDGQTGVLCRRPDAHSLANIIEELMDDRDRTRRIAQAAGDYVRTHHTVSAMADRVAALYRQLVWPRATFSLREPH
jgi:glycosyltransferase involved in cell wall biosynthesis